MKFERIPRNYVPDVLDKIPTSQPPARAVVGIESPEEAAPFLKKILPADLQESLMSQAALLPEGTNRARVAVGKQEEGTRHPHDYIIEKDNGETTFYFIDPEHQMGKTKRAKGNLMAIKGELRPKIGNLLALRFSQDGSAPDISILRFRANNIDDSHIMKMSQQFEEAKKLLGSEEVPEFLSGIERDITFRLEVRAKSMSVQSRYATSEQLDGLLHGFIDTQALKGKVWAYAEIFKHFVQHMEAGHFQMISEPKAAAIEPLKEAA
jgi:hypothetical protein